VTIRIFQHYWQLPLALLAILEGTIFLRQCTTPRRSR
jgi:hypothetical protein